MPARVPTPSVDPVAWDYLFVGTKARAAPGIVRSIVPRRAWDVDKKKGGGTGGHTLTTNGEKPMEWDITLEFWESEDNQHLDDELQRVGYFIEALFPTNLKLPTPFDVRHPILALHNIRALFFEEIEGPTKTGANVWQIKLKASNFKVVKRKPATSTPTGSKPLGVGNALPGGGSPEGPPPPPGWKPPLSPDSGPMPT